jgi:hypothetical protein
MSDMQAGTSADMAADMHGCDAGDDFGKIRLYAFPCVVEVSIVPLYSTYQNVLRFVTSELRIRLSGHQTCLQLDSLVGCTKQDIHSALQPRERSLLCL